MTKLEKFSRRLSSSNLLVWAHENDGLCALSSPAVLIKQRKLKQWKRYEKVLAELSIDFSIVTRQNCVVLTQSQLCWVLSCSQNLNFCEWSSAVSAVNVDNLSDVNIWKMIYFFCMFTYHIFIYANFSMNRPKKSAHKTMHNNINNPRVQPHDGEWANLQCDVECVTVGRIQLKIIFRIYSQLIHRASLALSEFSTF